MRKQRSDSVLKTLPEERQHAIFDLFRDLSLGAIQQHLAQDGLQTSITALSDFRSWYQLRSAFRQAESDTLSILELLKKEMPDLPSEKISALGETLFNLEAIKLQDPKLFLAMQTARHKGQMDKLNYEQRERHLAQQQAALNLEQEKFQFSAAEACLKHLPALRQIANSSLDQSAKLQQIRQKLFGQLPE